MKQCFVIMPYGKDEKERKHYFGVYQSIIVPAALKAGYVARRSDIAGEPGNITHDIIRELANCEIVLADLTSANANVFFELGIRHAFRKSGTVHIVDASHELPFDIRQYRALSYSTDLSEVPQTIEQITEAIRRRESQPERSDNPVHDAIPDLPVDVLSTGDPALRKHIKQLQDSVDNLERERNSLEDKITKLDPSGSFSKHSSELDIDGLFDEADAIMQETGEHVLLRLRSSLAEGGKDAFVRELRQVIKSPNLHQNDYLSIVGICQKEGLEGHRRAILEVATRRYPYNESIFLGLIDAYDDSPNLAIKENGGAYFWKNI